MRPGVEWLRRRRVPGTLAIFFFIFGVLGLFVLLFWLAVPPALNQIKEALAQHAGSSTVGHSTGIRHDVIAWVDTHLRKLLSGTSIFHPIATYGHKATNVVVAFLFTVAATWYWVSERDTMIDLLVRLSPEERRASVRQTYLEIDRRLGAYTRLKFLLGLAREGASAQPQPPRRRLRRRVASCRPPSARPVVPGHRPYPEHLPHFESEFARLRGSKSMRRAVSIGLVFAGIALAAASAGLASQKPRLPSGFRDTVVFRGLDRPNAIRFARDGRVFVAEQGGEILVYKNIHARKPVVFADLSREVNSFWERGLLGLALAPGFPEIPYVYVLYTHDAVPGGKVPRWHDKCPTPPGYLHDGCVVTGTLSRLRARGDRMVGKEQVLIQGWCQQFPTHSLGDLRFGPDGALYASAGEGAAFLKRDWGQYGGSKHSPTPRNPCSDPPAGLGGLERPPSAEGGSLRAQSLRRPAGQPVTLDGTIIRVDPATGAALPSNPLARARSANARRIVAYGLRNPYRFTFRPGTSEIWTGDVGEYLWEEIDRVVNPTKGPVPNFGWPCYEGPISHPGFSKLALCKTLPPRKVVYPYFAYNHWQPAVKGDECSVKPGASITGLAFYTGRSYPAGYRRGLFFADYTRNCTWFMPAGAHGLPAPKKTRIFSITTQRPVDLESGPGGDIYYVDISDGTVHRLSYSGATK